VLHEINLQIFFCFCGAFGVCDITKTERALSVLCGVPSTGRKKISKISQKRGKTTDGSIHWITSEVILPPKKRNNEKREKDLACLFFLFPPVKSDVSLINRKRAIFFFFFTSVLLLSS
jgi:hypothetical protein